MAVIQNKATKTRTEHRRSERRGPEIFEEVYELILMLYPYVQGFPKSQRFVLGQRMEQTCVAIIAGIVEANMKKDKLPILQEVNIELEKLRIFTRLAKDLQFLDFKTTIYKKRT